MRRGIGMMSSGLGLVVALSCMVSCMAWAVASPPTQKQQDPGQGRKAPPGQRVEKPGQRGPKKVIRSEKEWRKLLTRQEYKVLRQKGTERPFRNEYDKHFKPGKYACAACGQVLFASQTKFNSGCGWPAFYATMAGDRVIRKPDFSHGMVRIEVICARCESHLGHVFRDAPQTPTGHRFCINSVALDFIPADAEKKEQAAKAKRSGSGNGTQRGRSAGGRGGAGRRGGGR